MSEPSVTVSAPGCFILFGDHARHYGEPAAAVAVEMRTRCNAQLSQKFTVNGEPMDPARHPHARAAVLHGWTDMDRPLALALSSEAPQELGLGNEAASTVACLGALSMLHDHMIYEQVARGAFDALSESDRGSDPLAISASAHGGVMALDARSAGESLWTFRKGQNAWQVTDIAPGDFHFVLGYTGTPSNPQEMMARLARFCAKNSFARETVKELGAVSRDGISALRKNDPAAVGISMNRSQRLLVNLGMSSPELDRLVRAALRHSCGAKLTGYGGGGCMVALASDAEAAAAAIEQAGGRAFILKLAREGVKPED